jgi:hypothetical protein
MTFTLKYQLGGRLLLIVIGGCILLVGGIIVLGILDNPDKGEVAVLVVGGLASILFIAFKTTYKVTIVKINGDKLFINNKEFHFSEMTYYFIRKETPKIEVLDIGLQSGKEITITGINHGQFGDEAGKFISFMEARFNEPGSVVKLKESKASVKFMKMKRLGKRVIKGIIYFYLLFDVFMLTIFLSGWKNFPFWSVLTGNLMLPMLILYAFGDD